MSDAILGQVALGYSPFIDRNRSVAATRLTVFPLRPDAVLDAAQLLSAVAGVWPADGGRVSLNVASESLLQDLLRAEPATNVMVEVPAFMAAEAANGEALLALHRHGNALLLKGRPLKELPREGAPLLHVVHHRVRRRPPCHGRRAGAGRRRAQHPARAVGRRHGGRDGVELLKPVMFAAVRRGLFMEELVRASGDDEMRNEMFICGVFSLLDRMFKQPFSELMRTIPVPQRVYQALVDGTGPYQPYFDLVKSVEGESLYDFREGADTLMMSVVEINRAELRALTAAAQLD